MDRILFLLAGGTAFWWACLGTAFLLVFATFSVRQAAKLRGTLAAAILVSSAIVFVTGPPLEDWTYFAWFASIAAFLFSLRFKAGVRVYFLRVAACLAGGWLLVLAANEWFYFRAASLSGVTDRPVYVIGDSLSAGIAVERKTWPQILREENGWQLENLAVAGARLQDALERQAPDVVKAEAGVLILVGGNDLVTGTAVAEFEANLDRLLASLSGPGRILVLVELPTIPGYRGYGRAQRRLAREHNAVLIPRRFLAGVLAKPGATLDGIHLSDTGHEHLAAVLHHLATGH